MRQRAQHPAANDTEHGEHFFGSEAAIGNQAHKERRNHRAYRERAVSSADFRVRKLQHAGQYVPMLTYQEPQMKYWRNMKKESLILSAVCMGERITAEFTEG